MAIESISSISSLEQAGLSSVMPGGNSQQAFSTQLLAEFNQVNQKMLHAEATLQDFAAGKSGNIHHVMLALEDAKLSFQLLAQMRNKLLEGYQEVLRMQI